MRILCAFLIAIVLLLSCFTFSVVAGSHGAAFVFKYSDAGEAVLTPMLAPRFGTILKSGPREINRGEILVCKQGTQTTKVKTEDGQESAVTEFTLTCDQRVFILTSVRFEEQ